MKKEKTSAEQNTPKKKGRWKKILVYSLLGLVILIAAIILTLDYSVAAAVRSFGSAATGTTVSLDSFRFNIFSSRAVINQLAVANPPGYDHPSAIELGRVVFDLDNSTVLSDKIVVEEVTVEGLVMNYDLRINGDSNLGDIKKNLDKFAKSAEEDAEAKKEGRPEPNPDEETEAASKQVVIKKFLLKDSYFVISSSSLNIHARIPLPTLEMENIGEGKSFGETLGDIYEAILQSGLTAAAKSGNALGDVGSMIGSGLKGAGDGLEKGAKGAIDAVKGLFK